MYSCHKKHYLPFLHLLASCGCLSALPDNIKEGEAGVLVFRPTVRTPQQFSWRKVTATNKSDITLNVCTSKDCREKYVQEQTPNGFNLTINQISRDDEGAYRVFCSNSSYSTPATLTVISSTREEQGNLFYSHIHIYNVLL